MENHVYWNRHESLLFGLSFMAVVILLVAGCAAGGVSSPLFIYPVKVVCQSEQLAFNGIQPVNVTAPALDDAGRQENISTSVNVHNFSRQDISITFRAVAGGAPSADQTATIVSSQLRNFQCGEFITLVRGTNPGQSTPLTEGFLVIESSVELQVAAVYSRRSQAAGLRDRLSGFGFYAAAKNVYTEEEVPPVELVPLQPLGTIGETELDSGSGSNSAKTRQLSTETIIAPGEEIEGDGVIQIPIIPRPTTVSGAGLGIGLGYGVGRGIGVGIGVGSSIDVEYIEPRRL